MVIHAGRPDSSGSVVTMLWARRPGIGSKQDRIFLFAVTSKPTVVPTQHPLQWVPWLKQPGREANHTHPSNAEVTNASTSPYI
jgi:hypothetical protein